MDKFKEKTIYDYIDWDIDCKYNSNNYNRCLSKLKAIFKRKAKRKLKAELRKELKEENGI